MTPEPAISWATIANNAILLVIAVLAAWTAWKAKQSAKKAQETKQTVDVIHTLVNSQMGEQLRIAMVSAKTLASVKPSKANMQLALDAELKWRDHETKQAKVDAKI